MTVELIDDFFAEYPATAGSDKVNTSEADEVVIDAIAKTVAELTSQQDGVIRQQVIEELMRQIANPVSACALRFGWRPCFWSSRPSPPICSGCSSTRRPPRSADALRGRMTVMLKSVLAAMAGLFCAALAASTAWSADTTPKSYVVDNQDLDRLRADFNANAGTVRLLFIVGPT
jgi:hypothetical protein